MIVIFSNSSVGYGFQRPFSSRKNFGYHLKMFDFDLKAIMNFESQSKNLHSCLGTTVKGVGFFCLSGRLGSRL